VRNARAERKPSGREVVAQTFGFDAWARADDDLRGGGAARCASRRMEDCTVVLTAAAGEVQAKPTSVTTPANRLTTKGRSFTFGRR
jgi:hypothetical protein